MTTPSQTTVQCPNCGTPNAVVLRRVVDAKRDPQGKAQLLNGTINTFRCSSCGTSNTISSPLLYHDGAKELLIAFVPMDVAMRHGGSEEKMVGDLMNELNRIIPKDEFRAYMFNPKRALTLKGLIDQVMESEGITPEMVAQQKMRVETVQRFLEATSEEALIRLVSEYDSQIDMTFFQTISLMAQRLMQTGQQQAVAHLAAIQEVLLQHSSYGNTLLQRQQQQEESIRAVADDLSALGEQMTVNDLLQLVVQYADNEDKLEAVVGMVRPAFDDAFFAAFTEYIGKAAAAEREKLEGVRGHLQQLAEMVDEQARAMIQQKAQFLQALLSSPNFEALLSENLEMVDDNFMAVLSANVQEAERRKDLNALAKLRRIYDTVVGMLQNQMTPELRFLNDLLSAPDEATMQQMVQQGAAEFGGDLLEVVDAIERLFTAQGQQEGLQRLQRIRAAISQFIG